MRDLVKHLGEMTRDITQEVSGVSHRCLLGWSRSPLHRVQPRLPEGWVGTLPWRDKVSTHPAQHHYGVQVINFYARNGDEITLEQYAALADDSDYKVVEQTDIGPYWVSTIWLGLDHNFWGSGPPVIFETAVFATSQRDDPEDRRLTDLDMHRWSTEEEAQRGHEEICTLVRATVQNLEV